MNIHSVTSPTELTTALDAANGGDRIELAPGDYGSRNFNQIYVSEVTVVSRDWQNPAVFGAVSFSNAVMIKLLNVKVAGALNDSGAPTGKKGLTVSGSRNIIIENNEIFGWVKAIHALGGNTDLIIRGNDIYFCSGDCVNVNATDGLLFEGNWLHHFLLVSAGHSDFFQTWNPDPAHPAKNYTIRGNFFDGGAGPDAIPPSRGAQGCFMRNGVFEKSGEDVDRYQNILIEHNVIYNAHVHGITVGATNGLTIRQNTLLWDSAVDSGSPGSAPPRLNIHAGSSDIDASLNIIGKAISGAGVSDNFVIAPSDYDTLLVGVPVAGGATLAQLRAVPGGEIIAGGFGADMTRMDILLITGPQSEGDVVEPPVEPPSDLEERVVRLEEWRAAVLAAAEG